MQKYENLVDVVKDFPTSISEYFLGKIGVDTAENEPLKVWGSLTYVIRNLNLSSISHTPALYWKTI